MKKLILLFVISCGNWACASLSTDAKNQFDKSVNHLEANFHHPDIKTGAVIASPSQTHPDYFYHWTRDSALVMRSLLLVNSISDKQNEDLKNWVGFETQIQNLPAPAGLAETRFHVDGTLETAYWMKPQFDGPALRARTMTLWALGLLESGQKDFVVNLLADPIKKDLDFTMAHWTESGFDVWEETKGNHFFTRVAQAKALQLGAKLFNRLGNSDYAIQLLHAANKVAQSLSSFWSEKNQLIMPDLNVDGAVKKISQVDLIILLSSLYLQEDPDDAFYISNDKILSSIKKYHDSFGSYDINKNADAKLKMLGRYPEDTYDGFNPNDHGNPWFLANLGYAQSLCRLSKHYSSVQKIKITPLNRKFWSDFTQSPLRKNDMVAEREKEFGEIISNMNRTAQNYFSQILKYADADGNLTEQFSRIDGHEMGAQNLSWSHASYITAYLECRDLL